jgi:HEAT repeat protein
MRVEAALALARLGDSAGPPALERLAHSTNPVVRRQAAAAMGQVPSPEYRATLIRLLDDQYSIRLAALESLSKVAGDEILANPDADRGTVEERIARWKRGKDAGLK